MTHKVVLFYPWVGYAVNQRTEHRVPYSLLTLVGPLKRAGYEVILIDGRIDNKEILFKEAKDALFVGITSMTGIQLVDASKTAKNLKKMYPGVPIVWGGWHVTLLPYESIRESFVDIVSVGQGERAIVEIADTISHKGTGLIEVKGILTKFAAGQHGKGLVPRPLEPIVPDIDFSSIDLTKYGPFLGYLSSHGCPFDCTFCAIAKVYKRKFFSRPVDEVVRDLKYIFDNYKCFRQISLDDDNFTIKRDRVEEFCDKWNNYANVPISILAHVRAILSYPDTLWEKMINAGIRIFLIGAESGNQIILDRLKKHQTPEQMLRFVEKTRKFGVQADLSCMTGFPDSEELNDFRDTALFLQKANEINPFMKFKIFWIRPYPGTALYDDFVNQGIKMPSNMQEWSHYTLRSKPDWVSRRLYDMVNFWLYQWLPVMGWNWTWEQFEENFEKNRKIGNITTETLLI